MQHSQALLGIVLWSPALWGLSGDCNLLPWEPALVLTPVTTLCPAAIPSLGFCPHAPQCLTLALTDWDLLPPLPASPSLLATVLVLASPFAELESLLWMNECLYFHPHSSILKNGFFIEEKIF